MLYQSETAQNDMATDPEDFIPPSALGSIHICGAHIPDVLTASICCPLVVLGGHSCTQHLPFHALLHFHIQNYHLQASRLCMTRKPGCSAGYYSC